MGGPNLESTRKRKLVRGEEGREEGSTHAGSPVHYDSCKDENDLKKEGRSFNHYLLTTDNKDKAAAALNDFMEIRSYVEGWSFSSADRELFEKFEGAVPDAARYPHLYRWYIHIAALLSRRGTRTAMTVASPLAASPPTPTVGRKGIEMGDDRLILKRRRIKEANKRTAINGTKQRTTLVAIEIKPWEAQQDLMKLWKTITATIVQGGLKWGESCHLVPVAADGIQKIQCTFVMSGVGFHQHSPEDVMERILLEMQDDVQSVDITSMNVL